MTGTVTVTWDYLLLLTLFNRIKQTQNRQAEWECRFSPGHGRNEEYITFLDNFAKEVGAESWEAVNFHVHMAIRNDGERFSPNAKKAALEAGFLSEKESKVPDTRPAGHLRRR
jgi:hypothetical protein